MIEFIGRELGLENLQFDDEGLCTLMLDDEWPVIFRGQDGGSELAVMAELPLRAGAEDYELLRLAMSFNFGTAVLGGPVLTLSQGDGALVLVDRFQPASDDHDQTVENWFKEFMITYQNCSTVVGLQALLEARDQQHEPDATGSPDSSAAAENDREGENESEFVRV